MLTAAFQNPHMGDRLDFGKRFQRRDARKPRLRGQYCTDTPAVVLAVLRPYASQAPAGGSSTRGSITSVDRVSMRSRVLMQTFVGMFKW